MARHFVYANEVQNLYNMNISIRQRVNLKMKAYLGFYISRTVSRTEPKFQVRVHLDHVIISFEK